MPFDGSGGFDRVHNWGTDKLNNVLITASRMDAEDDGFATGLANCITKDGQTTVTANIPLNGFKLTGIGDATAATDALNRQTADARYTRLVGGTSLSAVTAVSASAVDLTAGRYFTKTASGSLTWTFTGPAASGVDAFLLRLTNGGTGTQTWPAAVKWPGGTAPTFVSSGVDMLVFITRDAGTTWRGALVMSDSK